MRKPVTAHPDAEQEQRHVPDRPLARAGVPPMRLKPEVATRPKVVRTRLNGDTSITFADIRKVLGADRGDEVVSLLKAAMHHPRRVKPEQLDTALSLARGNAAGKTGFQALPAFRRYFEDDPRALKHFTAWVERFRQGLTPEGDHR